MTLKDTETSAQKGSDIKGSDQKSSDKESGLLEAVWSTVDNFATLLKSAKESPKGTGAEHLPSVEIVGGSPEGTKVPNNKKEMSDAEKKKLSDDVEDLNDACGGWYSDLKAFDKALAGKTPEQLDYMNKLYKEKFGITLEEQCKDLMPPLSLKVRVDMANSRKAERDQLQRDIANVDRSAMEKIADQLHDNKPMSAKLYAISAGANMALGHEKWKPQEHLAEKLLPGKTDAERQVLKDVFKQKYGEELEAYLANQGGGDRAVRELNHKDKYFKALPAEKLPEAREKAQLLANELDRPYEADGSVVRRTLEKLDGNERKMVANYYEEITGKPLTEDIKRKFDGTSELELLNYVEYGSKDEVGVMQVNIAKGADAQVRTELRNMSKAEIDALDKVYQERYGKTLRETLMAEDDLSDATKKSLDIYLKGADKRTDDDWKALIDIALTANVRKPSYSMSYQVQFENNGNMEMLQEIMSSKSISPEFREQWLKDGGKDKLEKAFMFGGYDHAVDYVKNGGLSLTTKIDDNSGTLNDDEDGIDRAADEANDHDRQLYKRGLEIQRAWEAEHKNDEDFALLKQFDTSFGPDPDNYTGSDKEAYKFFRSVNSELWDAADDWDEFHSYTDRLTYKGGHGQAVKDIENMSREQWQSLKDDPAKQQEYLKNFEHLSDSYRKRCEELFAKKIGQESFDMADAVHKKSIQGDIDQARYTPYGGYNPYKYQPSKVYDAILDMNADDQRKYREDASFRKSVDEFVNNNLSSENQKEAASGMLEKVAQGKAPSTDFIDRIFQEGGKDETDETKVVRELEKAFRASEEKGEQPTLKERVTNPQTDEDKALAKRLDKALHGALEDDEYEQYAKPLLETGRLSMEQKMFIHKEEDMGKKAVFEDVFMLAKAKDPASVAERKRFVEDKEYQNKVLESLPEDQRRVAFNLISQGEARPEDLARAYVLGLGPSKEEVQEAVKVLDAKGNDNFKSEYARKYDQDITEDFVDKLSGKDERAMVREVRRDPETIREAVRDVQKDVISVRSGAGASFVDNFTGTGHMVENSYYQMAGEAENAAVTGKQVSPEKIRQLQDDVYTNIELNIEAKEAVANAVADVVLTAAAIAIPGGISLLSLTALGVGGGLLKVGAKNLIMGENYDSSKVLEDFGTGFIDASLGNLAPGGVAKMIGIGEKVGAKAAANVVTKALSEGGERLVKEGAEAVLEKGAQKLMRESIVNGTYKVADKEIDILARQVVKKGASEADVALVSQSIKQNLAKGLETEIRTGIKATVMQHGLEVAGGTIGAASSGLTRGLFAWDSNKSFSENLMNTLETTFVSAAFGAGGTVAFGAVFRAGGKVYRGIAGGEKAVANQGAEILAREGDTVLLRPAGAKAAEGTPITVSEHDLTKEYTRVSDSNYYIDDTGHTLTVRSRNTDGSVELVPDNSVIAAVDQEILDAFKFRAVGMTDQEQQALLNRVGKLNMAKAETIDKFVDGAAAVTEKWDNLTPLAEWNQFTEDRVMDAAERYENEVMQKMQGRVPEKDSMSPSKMRQHVLNDPEKLKIVDEFIDARKVHADSSKSLKDELDLREEAIQKMVDDFADAHGLPRTKISIDGNGRLEAGADKASGSYRDGQIKLNRAGVLSNRDPGELIDTIYHEFVHNEQDYMILRHISDELNIGQKASAEQMTKLRELYEQRTGQKLSDSHMGEVLKARNGRTLTPDEALRAQDLTDAFKNMHPLDVRFDQAKADIRVANNELTKLAGENGAANLIERLAEDNGTLSKHLFGDNQPQFVKDLVQEFKTNGVVAPDAHTQQQLANTIRTRSNDIWQEHLTEYKKYMKANHEREAHFIGTKAANRMRSREPKAVASGANRGNIGTRDTAPMAAVEDPTTIGTRDTQPMAAVEDPTTKRVRTAPKTAAEDRTTIGTRDTQPMAAVEDPTKIR